ncbi:Sec-independent protein translocase subunit TatB [Wolbachia endosymbiont of Howardula sp.]|uniref:Sec-independent protein translocase subunit TatB n=1 Tax=Wolbachia endosymbiont of Howardula sp. TaxID=2916816 RepID=UPI00217EF6F6|nr:hypothetical protein [Wolbachia endosymbiont of Howardula sp.]UWI83074.1 hypothetical protein MC061_02075 [Wolbachia endosymbiont of Howardula sp.]
MFNIGFSEILVIALVSIIFLDKKKLPIVLDLIRVISRYLMIIKLKANEFIKDAGLEDFYKDCDSEQGNGIIRSNNNHLYPDTKKYPLPHHNRNNQVITQSTHK